MHECVYFCCMMNTKPKALLLFRNITLFCIIIVFKGTRNSYIKVPHMTGENDEWGETETKINKEKWGMLMAFCKELFIDKTDERQNCEWWVPANTHAHTRTHPHAQTRTNKHKLAQLSVFGHYTEFPFILYNLTQTPRDVASGPVFGSRQSPDQSSRGALVPTKSIFMPA